MALSSSLPLRLIGEFKLCGTDWDDQEFACLFKNLGRLGKGAGTSVRYVRYYGQVSGQTEVRFFGIGIDAIDAIPPGMAVVELDTKSVAVYRTALTGPILVWRDRLNWNWLNSSAGAAPVGEFTVLSPADWTSRGDTPIIEFIVSANAYFESGKILNDEVALVEYDRKWPSQYEEMVGWLRHTFPPELILRIEHYGSTAIPGIPAKPVIDILLEVPSFAEARRQMVPAFNKPDCECWWYHGHMIFIIRDRPMGVRTHHIHIAPAGHPVWDGLAFRDYLRAHPTEAKQYADLKRQLAEHYLTDREAYTNSKEQFVREITKKSLEVFPS